MRRRAQHGYGLTLARVAAMSPGLTAAVLDALGLSPARAPLLAPAPLRTWPPAPFAVTEGSVQSTGGGWDRAASPNPRVVASAGPETSLRAVAATVQGWLQAIALPATAIPELEITTRALAAYNAAALGFAGAVAPAAAVRVPALPGWQVGALLTLPLEWAGAGTPAPVVDIAGLTDLASSYDAAWDGLLDLVAAPLPFPDPATDTADAQTQLTQTTNVADLCAPLRGRLLANPSAAVTPALALLTAIDTRGAVDQLTFATTLVTTLAVDELALLATLTPGAIVLRAVYRRLAAAAAAGGAAVDPSAAIAALNGALGLPGVNAAELAITGPSVIPGEPDASTSWRLRPDSTDGAADDNGEPLAGWHELVLGRSIHCGATITAPGSPIFTGPAFPGTAALRASEVLAAQLATINPTNASTLAARLDVAARVAGNEGGLDAVRQADRGLLSLGMQRWSTDLDDELTVLLFKLCASDPDGFDAHFGVYGLGLDPMPDGSGQTPSTVALTSVAPAGTATALAPAPADGTVAAARLTFFGGYQVDAGHCTFIDPADDTVRTPWAARARSAVRCSRTLVATELLHAASRFDRILADHPQVTIAGASLALQSVITSSRGAGQLLDQHVEHPDGVAASLAAAAAHAPPLTLSGDAPTAGWVAAFEAVYQHYVSYGDSTSATTRVNYINATGLDPTPGSFAAGWTDAP